MYTVMFYDCKDKVWHPIVSVKDCDSALRVMKRFPIAKIVKEGK